MQRRLTAGVAVLASLPALGGRAGQELPAPEGWQWALDAPARHVTELKPPRGAFLFGRMPPGWHITMGPGAVLFDPARMATGRFSVEAEMFLFPGSSQEGYGLFAGGADLDREARAYTAFLIRRDGSAAVTRQRGSETTYARGWTRHDAILPQQGGQNVRNVIRVESRLDDVRFLANGAELAVLPKADLALDGVVGFRIGRDLNLHAATFDLTHHLAPARP